jgi:hypothetical protein
VYFRPQARGWETPTLLGPLEQANLNHQTTDMGCPVNEFSAFTSLKISTNYTYGAKFSNENGMFRSFINIMLAV